MCFNLIGAPCNEMLPCFPFHTGFTYHTEETLDHAEFNGTNFQNRIHSCTTHEYFKNTLQIHVPWFCSSIKYLNTSNKFFRHNHLKNGEFAVIIIALWLPILNFNMFIETDLTHIQNAFSVLQCSECCLPLCQKQNRESLRKTLLWIN